MLRGESGYSCVCGREKLDGLQGPDRIFAASAAATLFEQQAGAKSDNLLDGKVLDTPSPVGIVFLTRSPVWVFVASGFRARTG
jgi:hypothetical protein